MGRASSLPPPDDLTVVPTHSSDSASLPLKRESGRLNTRMPESPPSDARDELDSEVLEEATVICEAG